MAIVNCPSCAAEMSTRAPRCPQCGHVPGTGPGEPRLGEPRLATRPEIAPPLIVALVTSALTVMISLTLRFGGPFLYQHGFAELWRWVGWGNLLLMCATPVLILIHLCVSGKTTR